jgi:hypothetical protein
MDNLAGVQDCDLQIGRELNRARIPIVRFRSAGEVPFSIAGKLGQFEFERAWRYWIARGKVPLKVAKELYEDPVGRTDIRVYGHAGRPSPERWVRYFDRKGRELFSITDKEEICALAEKSEMAAELKKRVLNDPNMRFIKDPTKGKAFIPFYHIDSEVGLRIFADTLKKYRLV